MMATETHTELVVRQFLDENFLTRESSDPIGSDESLTASGILDSMGVLELIMFLEERFHLSVEDEEAVPKNLDTIANIVSFVEAKIRASGATAA